MKNKLGARAHEFDAYLAALADLKADMSFLENGRYICNVDFSLFYPFFWEDEAKIETFSDKLRLNLFYNYIEYSQFSRMKFVFTRSTIFEMLTSIYSKFKKINKIHEQPKTIEVHQKEIDRVLSDDVVNADYYAQRLNYFYNLMPNNNGTSNIDLTINLLSQGVISSVYDVYGFEEVRRLRSEINQLTDEISPKFYQKPSRSDDPHFKQLAKDVDCRNIATSVILSKNFKNYNMPYLCARNGHKSRQSHPTIHRQDRTLDRLRRES